ncbi:MAG TPA: succinylglutamate-semialdehyde dehydrogenase [Tepidisphaeraceae bacterium]|nr:succinylglutamate-semialdehyde dehydrogenase [Tepidisphaeraceae bacterium]
MSKGHFIHGSWNVSGGVEMSALDPATGETVWQGRAAGGAEIDRAVASARELLEHWSNRTLAERAEFIETFGQRLKQRHAVLTESISRQTGKPRWEAATETDAVINKIGATLEAHDQRRMASMRPMTGATGTTRYKPHGVVAVLGPFNFPAHLPCGHIIPALLAGNTVVFKPSELAPQVAEVLADIWHESGLPGGVLNVIQGARDTGQRLVSHAGIDGVFFTGSYDAGRAISRSLADQPGKIVALEMGGNNPLVVYQSYDFEAAAYWTVQSAYITAGQRCSCARRLIVVDDGSQSDLFIDRLVQMIKRIIVGKYTDQPEPFMGPVISDLAANKILTAQQDLLARGGKALVPLRSVGPRRAMLTPGLIDVSSVTNRPDEEIFGPLLQLVRVTDFDQAIAEANNTKYGLSAGLFCEDQEHWKTFYSQIRAGVVNWNRPLTGASTLLPFGGIGRSGNNRPSAYFATDYCSYPVASIESETLEFPQQLTPGL